SPADSGRRAADPFLAAVIGSVAGRVGRRSAVLRPLGVLDHAHLGHNARQRELLAVVLHATGVAHLSALLSFARGHVLGGNSPRRNATWIRGAARRPGLVLDLSFELGDTVWRRKWCARPLLVLGRRRTVLPSVAFHRALARRSATCAPLRWFGAWGVLAARRCACVGGCPR